MLSLFELLITNDELWLYSLQVNCEWSVVSNKHIGSYSLAINSSCITIVAVEPAAALHYAQALLFSKMQRLLSDRYRLGF